MELVFTVYGASFSSSDLFLLHGFGIFLLGEIATTLRMALASMGGMYIPLPVSPLLKFMEVIWMLKPHEFCLVRT